MSRTTTERVALFISSLRCGGAERMMVQVARGLAAAGIELDIVLIRAQGPLLNEIPASARVIDLGASRMRKAIWRLAKYLRRERPRALLSRIIHANLGAVLARELSRVPTRVVLTEASNFSAGVAAGFVTPHLAIASRWLYPRADELVAVSAGVARDLERSLKLPAGRVRVIYNPVVDERMAGRAANRPIILGCSIAACRRSCRWVDWDPKRTRPRCWRHLRVVRRTRPARLVIFGEGSQRGELEALRRQLGLEADVALPGLTVNPYSAMSRAALFVLSSRFEGLPNALIEALACGCPVVSTDCPSGPDEILADPAHGLLVPPGDPPALARAMLEALDRRWDRGAAGGGTEHASRWRPRFRNTSTPWASRPFAPAAGRGVTRRPMGLRLACRCLALREQAIALAPTG